MLEAPHIISNQTYELRIHSGTSLVTVFTYRTWWKGEPKSLGTGTPATDILNVDTKVTPVMEAKDELRPSTCSIVSTQHCSAIGVAY